MDSIDGDPSRLWRRKVTRRTQESDRFLFTSLILEIMSSSFQVGIALGNIEQLDALNTWLCVYGLGVATPNAVEVSMVYGLFYSVLSSFGSISLMV